MQNYNLLNIKKTGRLRGGKLPPNQIAIDVLSRKQQQHRQHTSKHVGTDDCNSSLDQHDLDTQRSIEGAAAASVEDSRSF